MKKRPASLEVVTLARPPMPVASGDPIAGGYTVIEHYGQGPLGHTYRAHDALGGVVAVKIVTRDLLPTTQERQAFVAAMEKLVGRDVPRVAMPVAVWTDDAVACVVSPWVPGKSLRRMLAAYREAGRAISREQVLGVIEGVVEALRSLHAFCAHGALYPESVQIAQDGAIVLTDAGLAGALPRARLVEHLERYPDVLPYVATEVRAGKRTNAGTDLYSIGALASELLTSDPGAAAAGIAGAMMPGMPREIDTALQGLLAPRSAVRAAALPPLLDALARAIGVRSVPSSVALPPQRQRTDVMPASTLEVPRTPRRR